ncbi:NAD(P)-binding protein [Lentinus tigrinus ALCF2SS1-7]|uniref:NAD(P)-binding protein n=1 Tax=Lentinus tigrinus ALCF2SS1-6 TaxID=1328759 RepID=A0A5C2RVV5_9APHY|nr:NAD(P)-binding protein [Lentinus tigrinus ALCF2SS1-6]RPD69968.1 NAD(P)-binding protein [Lentinus tigrinus ALCF2SS1-7]
MSPVRNARVVYKEVPEGFPIPGKTFVYDDSQTIDLENVPLNGGVLFKVLVVSVDPYMRRKMQDPSVDFHLGLFKVGEPLYNFSVSKVVRSENPALKEGDHIYGVFRQTAHHAWMEYAHPYSKKGDVAFVTAASGAVGAIVVQLAKADGLKVIASAGSDEKCEFVRSLGADVVFNYKTTSTREVLKKEGPVQMYAQRLAFPRSPTRSYWDNVGGESLDAALEWAAQKAHFVICGMISNYNTGEPYNVKNLQQVVWREITFHGFLVTSLWPKYDEEFNRMFPPRVASGELKYKDDLVRGLENAGQALVNVLSGTNFGKCSVVVADE